MYGVQHRACSASVACVHIACALATHPGAPSAGLHCTHQAIPLTHAALLLLPRRQSLASELLLTLLHGTPTAGTAYARRAARAAGGWLAFTLHKLKCCIPWAASGRTPLFDLHGEGIPFDSYFHRYCFHLGFVISPNGPAPLGRMRLCVRQACAPLKPPFAASFATALPLLCHSFAIAMRVGLPACFLISAFTCGCID